MNQKQQLDALSDIKKLMEKSSRFISLSGLSGVAAGLCALTGAWFANDIITTREAENFSAKNHFFSEDGSFNISLLLHDPLFITAAITFFAALIFSFVFTYLRSKKTGTPIWGFTSKRLMINVAIPLIAGFLFLLKLISIGVFSLIAPGCLIFYGLAVLNASKYTLPETRYLGCAEIFLGLISIVFSGNGLLFWTAGFGVLHIVYGIFMWIKYERTRNFESE